MVEARWDPNSNPHFETLSRDGQALFCQLLDHISGNKEKEFLGCAIHIDFIDIIIINY